MHRIVGIVSGALMRYGRMVVSVRQGADVPYQRERQQKQKPDGDNRCTGPRLHGRKGTTAEAAARSRSPVGVSRQQSKVSRLADALRKLRQQMSLSQREMAAKLGISRRQRAAQFAAADAQLAALGADA
jgi:hypothetical protein